MNKKRSDEIELRDYLRSLRTVVGDAQRDAEVDLQADLLKAFFILKEVRVELEVTAADDLSGGVEAKFFVIKSNVGAKKSTKRTQKLSLLLVPASPTLLGGEKRRTAVDD